MTAHLCAFIKSLDEHILTLFPQSGEIWKVCTDSDERLAKLNESNSMSQTGSTDLVQRCPLNWTRKRNFLRAPLFSITQALLLLPYCSNCLIAKDAAILLEFFFGIHFWNSLLKFSFEFLFWDRLARIAGDPIGWSKLMNHRLAWALTGPVLQDRQWSQSLKPIYTASEHVRKLCALNSKLIGIIKSTKIGEQWSLFFS